MHLILNKVLIEEREEVPVNFFFINLILFFCRSHSRYRRGAEEAVHVSGYGAPTKVFAMPYGTYGGAGYGYGLAASSYGYAPAASSYGYAPTSSYGYAPVSAYAPTSSYAPEYKPASTYAHGSDYKPASTYATSGDYKAATDYSSASKFNVATSYAPSHYNAASRHGYGYAPAHSYGSNYGSNYGHYAGYGANYGPSNYGHVDGKLVSVIDRQHGYGNVGYGKPTQFLTNVY